MTELLGVSRITVRHALANLEAAGVLRREHGRGTFVRAPRLVAGTRALTSFSDEMAAVGVAVGAEVLDVGRVGADPMLADALEIAEGDEVVRVSRLRLGDGQPIGVQRAHLRADRVVGLDESVVATGSLYSMLRARYGIVPTRATEVFRVDTADAEDAAVLDIDVGTAVFAVERVTSDERGPFELTRSTMRGDRYEIRSTLHPT